MHDPQVLVQAGLTTQEIYVLSCYFFDCLQIHEIAEQLNITINTAWSKIYRAKEKVFQEFNINLTRKTVERKIDHFIQEDKIVYQW